jgi:hypothetical protein
MPRLIDDVHKQIIQLIPLEQISLREELENFIKSLWNKAPEVRLGPEVYIPYAEILAKWINPFNENLSDWESQVVSIYNGVDINKQYEEEMKDYDYQSTYNDTQ